MDGKRRRHYRSRRVRTSNAGAQLGISSDELFASIYGEGLKAAFARSDLAINLRDSITRLCDIALDEQDTIAARWAGETLARVYKYLHWYDAKVSEANAAYRETEAKLRNLRPDVLFPKSLVGQILQERLTTSMRYQHMLKVIRATDPEKLFREHKRKPKSVSVRLPRGKVLRFTPARKGFLVRLSGDKAPRTAPATWQEAAHMAKIPEQYWRIVDLPPFCKASERDWWKFIWSLLNAEPEVISRLQKSAKGRAEAKSRPVYLKHFYTQFHKHWLTLVRLREAGTF
jgi:hypothetical protein